MEEYKELQEEEVEVLKSIYEGDSFFNQLSDTCFQYKYGEEDNKSVLIEVSWPEKYPSELPHINLDLFHNSFLPDDFKQEIKEKLVEQASDLLDSAMTYSIFDWMKENGDEYLNRIPELLLIKKKCEEIKNNDGDSFDNTLKVKKEKKEQLTKAQKRKITSQTNYKGEHERGWDWVDVVRHLSQTGTGVQT